MRELDIGKLRDNIQNWIKEYVISAKADKVVVGLSGGIDSAVTAALSVKALGKENVFGLLMPCESISSDIEDAKMVAEFLGIRYELIDLTPVYQEFLRQLSNITEDQKVAKANLKARLRMVTLYFIAQSKGNCLVAGTGNRAELAIGYFTKYGDGGVDFEPLGTLYKSEVRAVAKVLNIPDKIITKAPSPGLWPGQTDEGEIGLLYDTIDEILYRIDNNLDFNGLKREEIERVKYLMRISEHKLKVPPYYVVE
jgi:NAD+ synthase